MIIQVAVAVIINDKNEIFISRRSVDQHQGDKWEFPGGKVEKGEIIEAALFREIKEEIGIEIDRPKKLIEIQHDYQTKQVQLHVYETREWSGEPKGMEGQLTCWISYEQLKELEFPEANQAIIDLLLKKQNSQ